jgi:predicted dinucleotide-utilizing enzyme
MTCLFHGNHEENIMAYPKDNHGLAVEISTERTIMIVVSIADASRFAQRHGLDVVHSSTHPLGVPEPFA